MPKMTSCEASRCHCYFNGHVQGVGFRCAASNLALSFNVGGFVRNLPDGTVELVVEGDPGEVKTFLSALDEKMGGFIRDSRHVTEPPTGEFTRFAIAY